MADGRPFVSRLTPEYLAAAGLSEDAGTPVAPTGFEGIDMENDHENVAKRARFLASKLDESNPERDRLLLVAKEAEAKNEQQQQQ
jgi:hypothetical protein